MTKRRLPRRELLRTSVATTAAAFACTGWAYGNLEADAMTVSGVIRADQLGMTLPHEHVLVDFVGADKVSPERYDQNEAFELILPHLKQVRDLGCQSLAECTPAWLGRDVSLLRRLSEASGIQLLTNTGYYGASSGKYLPKHAFTEDADSLARRWIAEWTDGIEGTDVRPGFIKIGVDSGPLTEVHRKLVQAAARTHLKSGLVIAAHTGDGNAALEQLKILRQEGVDGNAWIWVHAQNEKDPAVRRQVAEQGAWISLDGISPTSIARHVEMVVNLKQAELLHQVLISHDAGWYSVGEPQGGTYRGYETLFAEFLPALRKAGLTDADIELLTVSSPAKTFSIGIRKR